MPSAAKLTVEAGQESVLYTHTVNCQALIALFFHTHTRTLIEFPFRASKKAFDFCCTYRMSASFKGLRVTSWGDTPSELAYALALAGWG